ncbi:MAG: hypothetical protein R3F59_35400 [Myxococcota bacterium]
MSDGGVGDASSGAAPPSEGQGEPAPPSPGLPVRAVAQRMAFGACVGLALAIVAAGAWGFRYYRDDRALDRIVRIVALDWRDFGEDEARARLAYEFDRAHIGLWVRDEDCALQRDGDRRQVRCAWRVDVPVPGTRRRVPLAFQSLAWVGPDGALGP